MRQYCGLTSARRSLLLASTFALALGGASLIATAGSLGGVTGAVGGTVGSVGNTAGGVVGGVSGAVGATGNAVGDTVGGATKGTLSGTKATIGALNPKGVLQAKARSDLIGGIKAKLDVLSKKNLAKLCVGIGGGSGCGSGKSRHQLLGLIDVRLNLLSKKQLLGLCVSVGGTGCGGGSRTIVDNPPGNPPGDDTSGTRAVSSLSDNDKEKLKLNCRKVVQSPANYNRDMVAVCRLLQL
jgi:hypothetical protein